MLRAFLLSILAGVLGAVALAWLSREPAALPAPPATRPIADGIAISEQLRPADVTRLARQGFRTLVAMRPDGEAPDQPSSTAMADAARSAGMSFAYVPTPNGRVAPETVEALARTLDASGRPVLLYCRSGNRAARVWALSEASRAGGVNAQAIATAVRGAGHNADDLASEIDARIARRK